MLRMRSRSWLMMMRASAAAQSGKTGVTLPHRSFSIGGDDSASAAVASPLMQSMQDKLKEQLSAELVLVQDVSGDGRHVVIDVISSAFEGKSVMNRQRMVYKVIWEELQSTVHAVQKMSTKTPAEATNNK